MTPAFTTPARVLLVAVALLAGCGRERPAGNGAGVEAGPPPVLLLAVDALEWSEVLTRTKAGELPVLAGLMRSGRYGYLRSMVPSVSPVIWTTVATGRAPDDHGIQGFAKVDAPGGPATTLFNNWDRRRKAFWNVGTDRGRRTAVLGWWMTYPVDSLDGVMVAQVNTLDALAPGGSRPLMGGLDPGRPGQVFPPSREKELLAVGSGVAAGTDSTLAALFGDAFAGAAGDERRLFEEVAWAIRADATYLEIAHAIDPASFDVLAVYVGAIDVVSHRFWRYAHPGEFEHPPSAREIERFGGVLGAYYAHVDREIGRLLARYDRPPQVIVLSDHGMHAVNRAHRWADGDVEPLSGHHDDGPPGVVLLAGPRVAPPADPLAALPEDPAALRTLGSILDVTPTLLALLDLPQAADLPGEAWWSAILADSTRPRVPSYEDAGWTRAREALDPSAVADPGREERLAQLRALGYLH